MSSHVLNYSPSQYIVCNHEWTFLEGEKKHSHTLKAGRHLFPFELRLGGSLPSSITTPVNGGASVSYKLRAVAVRPGLSTNLSASIPVSILRTFAPESLEYQQTLEIENTWPDKLMYSLMIPHKAWAAGDELTSLVKFVPLAKGARVLTVTTHLCETTKTLTKGGHLERTRNVLTRKHEIVHGRAVSCDDHSQRRRLQHMLQNSLAGEGYNVGRHHLFASTQTASSSQVPSGSSSPGNFMSGTSTPIVEGSGLALTRPGSHDSNSSNASSSSSSAEEHHNQQVPGDVLLAEADENGGENSEVSTSISIVLPTTLTPSHSLDPILVSYRIRWSILIGNFDGHTSELRCSLPIHILDYSLLEEARQATSATRRLLFGGEDAERDAQEEDAQLPSYSSHVRDRVAMVDVAMPPEAQVYRPYAHDAHDSGTNTPMEYGLSEFPGFTHGLPTNPLPVLHSHTSSPEGPTPPFSITPPRHTGDLAMTPPSESAAADTSRPNSTHSGEPSSGSRLWNRASRSRAASRVNSRVPSRAASPERMDGAHAQQGLEPTVSRPDEIHVHSNNPAMRQQHGVFSAMMKPLTGLASHWSSSSHPHSHSHAASTHAHSRSIANGEVSHRSMTFPSVDGAVTGAPEYAPSVSSSHSSSEAARISLSSYSAVPDYFTASHNASGLPPLETLRDLPTYDDSEAQAINASQRSLSDTDLMSHFARRRGAPSTLSPLAQRAR